MHYTATSEGKKTVLPKVQNYKKCEESPKVHLEYTFLIGNWKAHTTLSKLNRFLANATLTNICAKNKLDV